MTTCFPEGSEEMKTSVGQKWPPEFLQVSVFYSDGLVTSRTVQLGDEVSISAGKGNCISRIAIVPAREAIKGVMIDSGCRP